MAVVHYVTRETLLPGGEKMVRGKLTVGTLGSSGTAALNLANYLKSSETPVILIDGFVENAANAAFPLSVNAANAEVITVQARCGGLGASQPLYAANAGLELTAANVDFVAIGQAY